MTMFRQSFEDISLLSKDEIQHFQVEFLRHSIGYALKYSPFYQSKLKGFDVAQISSPADLQILPTTSKEDASRTNKDFVCVDRSRIIDFVTTSGTIGRPIDVVLTANDMERLAYNEFLSFQLAGLSHKDVVQLMVTMDKRFMAGMAYHMGLRKLGAGIVRVGSGSPGLQFDSIYRYEPNVIVAVPSFFLRIIRYADEQGIDLASLSVKKAICIGEPLYQEDFTLNTLGRKIKERWDIELFSTYASTEMATAFTDCKVHNGGHHLPELVVVELLDDEEKPVPEGMPGEITFTSLGVEGMPFIRYKTGDIARAYHKACSCGRNTLRLGPVMGRKKQMIKLKGTTIFPAAIFEILETNPDIDSYLVEVSDRDLLSDHVKIYLSESILHKGIDVRLTDAFETHLRVKPELKFVSNESLQKLRFPKLERKPRRFIDTRPKILS